jgi:hydroxymethylglutaryl-CoA lyase
MAQVARVFEVGPRDGLQNESAILDVGTRVELIERLVEAGARDVEMGSFVHPKWLPQMANTDEVARQMRRAPGVRYWALVPNMRGLARAVEVGIEHIALFVSASETHNRKNLNRGVAESMEEIREVMAAAREQGMVARAYISMVFGCPYEGEISFDKVLGLGEALLEAGVSMLSLGDTTGIGMPLQVRRGCARAVERFGEERVALHLHDTRGMGVTNAMVAWEAGMRAFDSSVGGIGGCPYAPGAAGNLGSEDLVYLLDSMGIESGISLEALAQTSRWLEEVAQIKVPSRCTNYLQSARRDL